MKQVYHASYNIQLQEIVSIFDIFILLNLNHSII